MTDQPVFAWQTPVRVNRQLWLTPFRPDDADRLVQVLQDAEIHRNLLTMPFPYTHEHAQAFLETCLAQTPQNTQSADVDHCQFALRNNDDLVVGGAGLREIVTGHRADLGYWLDRPLWGQGHMTDVVAQLCLLARTHFQVVRLTAKVFFHNRPSARVLEKNHFQCEGHLKKYYRKNGRFLDSKLYARIY